MARFHKVGRYDQLRRNVTTNLAVIARCCERKINYWWKHVGCWGDQVTAIVVVLEDKVFGLNPTRLRALAPAPYRIKIKENHLLPQILYQNTHFLIQKTSQTEKIRKIKIYNTSTRGHLAKFGDIFKILVEYSNNKFTTIWE